MSKIRWKNGVLVGVFLALLSLYPQFYLEYQRGKDYNGFEPANWFDFFFSFLL